MQAMQIRRNTWKKKLSLIYFIESEHVSKFDARLFYSFSMICKVMQVELEAHKNKNLHIFVHCPFADLSVFQSKLRSRFPLWIIDTYISMDKCKLLLWKNLTFETSVFHCCALSKGFPHVFALWLTYSDC